MISRIARGPCRTAVALAAALLAAGSVSATEPVADPGAPAGAEAAAPPADAPAAAPAADAPAAEPAEKPSAHELLKLAKEKLAEAQARSARADQAYARMRRSHRPRGEARAEIIDERDEAARELAQARAEYEAAEREARMRR